jgi:hypothetical protein
MFLYSRGGGRVTVSNLCRIAAIPLVAPSVRDALPSFQSEPRLPRLNELQYRSPSRLDLQTGSRGSPPQDPSSLRLDLLLAAKCLRTAPTRIEMPLEDSWNHFDSPLGKAECVLTSWLSGLLCSKWLSPDSASGRQKSGCYKTEALFTLCNGLQPFAAENSCLLSSTSSQKGTIGLENSPQNSLGDLMFHHLVSPSSLRLVHLDVDCGGDTCPVSQWGKMNASHSISHLLDEIFTPELLAVFVVRIKYPFTSQPCFTGRPVTSLMQPSWAYLVYLPLTPELAKASANCLLL